MKGSDAAGRALQALLPGRGARPEILLGPGVKGSDAYAGPGSSVKERDLGRRMQARPGPAVVVVHKPTPTILRAVRRHPEVVLVILGDGEPPELPDTLVLGPGATLRIDGKATRAAGRVLACAHAPDELAGLCRALAQRPIAVAVSPTPPWLWRWLEHPALKGTTAVGYVPAASLEAGWARFGAHCAASHVLVPVGIDAPPLHAAAGDAQPATDPHTVVAAAAAHALERRTGPVFPAARVLSLILEGWAPKRAAGAATPEQLAMWTQARRALPLSGAAVGMAEPDPRLPLSAPTAAFLAQRALLRAAAFDAATKGKPPTVDDIDDEGAQRAAHVLRGAGETLTDQESKVVLRGFGFEVTRQAVASSASGAAGFAERIGYPVVLKALSPDLRRRSDVGGVVLALGTAAAVKRAYAAIVDNIERRAPTAHLDGVLVAEMIEGGLDVRCGGQRLPDGTVVVYGGIEGASTPVEPALALHPLSRADALALAHAIVSRAPVPALRRETDPDVRGLAHLLLRLSKLIEHTADRIVSVDLGPARLVGPPRHYITLDARITQRAHLEGE